MKIEQLKTLSKMKYEHSHQALSGLLTRENVLRTELLRLRSLTYETQTQPPNQAQMRMIGGDVIWLQWLGQAQRKLNIELAQILAQKETLLAQHRIAHGRKVVAEQIASQELECRQESKRKAQMENAINCSPLGLTQPFDTDRLSK